MLAYFKKLGRRMDGSMFCAVTGPGPTLRVPRRRPGRASRRRPLSETRASGMLFRRRRPPDRRPIARNPPPCFPSSALRAATPKGRTPRPRWEAKCSAWACGGGTRRRRASASSVAVLDAETTFGGAGIEQPSIPSAASVPGRDRAGEVRRPPEQGPGDRRGRRRKVLDAARAAAADLDSPW